MFARFAHAVSAMWQRVISPGARVCLSGSSGSTRSTCSSGSSGSTRSTRSTRSSYSYRDEDSRKKSRGSGDEPVSRELVAPLPSAQQRLPYQNLPHRLVVLPVLLASALVATSCSGSTGSAGSSATSAPVAASDTATSNTGSTSASSGPATSGAPSGADSPTTAGNTLLGSRNAEQVGELSKQESADAHDNLLLPTPTGTSEELLDRLGVRPTSGTNSSYQRKEFGPAWADIDRNGCDTRNDILARDLTDTTTKPGTHDCVVLTGTLNDPYTGTVINFQRGNKTSNAVQIDHVVALANAWASGADEIPYAARVALANDPLNLLAVDGPTNQAKSASDAAGWLPGNTSFQCTYVTRQVEVKAKYHLTITQAEKTAMKGVLGACGG